MLTSSFQPTSPVCNHPSSSTSSVVTPLYPINTCLPRNNICQNIRKLNINWHEICIILMKKRLGCCCHTSKADSYQKVTVNNKGEFRVHPRLSIMHYGPNILSFIFIQPCFFIQGILHQDINFCISYSTACNR